LPPPSYAELSRASGVHPCRPRPGPLRDAELDRGPPHRWTEWPRPRPAIEALRIASALATQARPHSHFKQPGELAASVASVQILVRTDYPSDGPFRCCSGGVRMTAEAPLASRRIKTMRLHRTRRS